MDGSEYDHDDTRIAEAIRYAAKHLGKGDAADERGCLEFMAVQTKEGLDGIAAALDRVADAIHRYCDARGEG